MKRITLTFLLSAIFMLFSENGNAQLARQSKQVKINGRIQYDFEFFKREKDHDWRVGNEFRRVHLSAAGKTGKYFKYKVEVNFAHGKLGFRDVYLEYVNPSVGHIAVGSKAEPTGLEMATSSKYIPFAERAMLTALENFRWGTGIHYACHGLFDKRAGIQMALTNKGVNSEGFVDKQLEKGMNFAARVYGTPLWDTDKKFLWHVGANYATRPYKDLKFRPENHMGDKYHYVVPGGQRRLETGFETAVVYGPYSLQGEYKTAEIAAQNARYDISGYYAMAGIFVTGESRPYKHGAFGRVKPRKDVAHGGYGAVEVLARYSVMEFPSDLIQLPENTGLPGRIQNTALGINWYLTSHVRLMYNFILTADKHPSGNLNTHILRFQVDF